MRVHIEYQRARVALGRDARVPPSNRGHWATSFEKAQIGAAFDVELKNGFLVFTWCDRPKSHMIVNDLVGVEACCDGLIGRTRRLHGAGENDLLSFACGGGLTHWRHGDADLRADAVVVAGEVWKRFQRAT